MILIYCFSNVVHIFIILMMNVMVSNSNYPNYLAIPKPDDNVCQHNFNDQYYNYDVKSVKGPFKYIGLQKMNPQELILSLYNPYYYFYSTVKPGEQPKIPLEIYTKLMTENEFSLNPTKNDIRYMGINPKYWKKRPEFYEVNKKIASLYAIYKLLRTLGHNPEFYGDKVYDIITTKNKAEKGEESTSPGSTSLITGCMDSVLEKCCCGKPEEEEEETARLITDKFEEEEEGNPSSESTSLTNKKTPGNPSSASTSLTNKKTPGYAMLKRFGFGKNKAKKGEEGSTSSASTSLSQHKLDLNDILMLDEVREREPEDKDGPNFSEITFDELILLEIFEDYLPKVDEPVGEYIERYNSLVMRYFYLKPTLLHDDNKIQIKALSKDRVNNLKLPFLLKFESYNHYVLRMKNLNIVPLRLDFLKQNFNVFKDWKQVTIFEELGFRKTADNLIIS